MCCQTLTQRELIPDHWHDLRPNHLKTVGVSMSQTIIQVIEVQALVWLGSMFAPLLPAVGCLGLLLIFQTKYFLAIFLLSPPRVRFSAQRTSTLAYFLLLGRHPARAHSLVINVSV